MSLTDLEIRHAKPDPVTKRELRDDRTPGLMVRISRRGVKTWSYQTRIHGEQRRFPIGRYPEIGVAEARRQAAILRADALKGKDPIRAKRASVEKAERKREAVRAAPKVRDLLQEYEDTYLRPKLRGWRNRRRELDRALADLLDKPVKSLKRGMLQRVVDQKALAAPTSANRLSSAISAFVRWAVKREKAPSDLFLPLEKPTKERPRDRVLTLEEVRAIYEAAGDVGAPFDAIFRLLLLTAQRRSEVCDMRFGELDLVRRRWEIPSARAKNGRPHIVHLSAPAMVEVQRRIDLLRALGVALERHTLLFSTTGRTPVSGISKPRRRLDEILGARFPGTISDRFTLHDFRTAFATAMGEAGQPEGVIDRILNHVATTSAASAVARVYNRADLLPQRAQVLDAWAEIVTGARGEIISFSNAAQSE